MLSVSSKTSSSAWGKNGLRPYPKGPDPALPLQALHNLTMLPVLGLTVGAGPAARVSDRGSPTRPVRRLRGGRPARRGAGAGCVAPEASGSLFGTGAASDRGSRATRRSTHAYDYSVDEARVPWLAPVGRRAVQGVGRPEPVVQAPQ